MYKLQVVLIPPSAKDAFIQMNVPTNPNESSQTIHNRSNVLPNTMMNGVETSMQFINPNMTNTSMIRPNFIGQSKIKKFLHFTKPSNSLFDLSEEILSKCEKMYPSVANEVEILSLQDISGCDLDPDFIVKDIFNIENTVRVILKNELNTDDQASTSLYRNYKRRKLNDGVSQQTNHLPLGNNIQSHSNGTLNIGKKRSATSSGIRPSINGTSALRISTPLARQIYPPSGMTKISNNSDDENDDFSERSFLPPPNQPQSPPIRISSGMDTTKKIKSTVIEEDTVSRSEMVDPDKSKQQRILSGTPGRSTMTPNRVTLTGQRVLSENYGNSNGNGLIFSGSKQTAMKRQEQPPVSSPRITSGMLTIPEPKISEVEKELHEGPSSPASILPAKSDRIPMKKPYSERNSDMATDLNEDYEEELEENHAYNTKPNKLFDNLISKETTVKATSPPQRKTSLQTKVNNKATRISSQQYQEEDLKRISSFPDDDEDEEQEKKEIPEDQHKISAIGQPNATFDNTEAIQDIEIDNEDEASELIDNTSEKADGDFSPNEKTELLKMIDNFIPEPSSSAKKLEQHDKKIKEQPGRKSPTLKDVIKESQTSSVQVDKLKPKNISGEKDVKKQDSISSIGTTLNAAEIKMNSKKRVNEESKENAIVKKPLTKSVSGSSSINTQPKKSKVEMEPIPVAKGNKMKTLEFSTDEESTDDENDTTPKKKIENTTAVGKFKFKKQEEELPISRSHKDIKLASPQETEKKPTQSVTSTKKIIENKAIVDKKTSSGSDSDPTSSASSSDESESSSSSSEDENDRNVTLSKPGKNPFAGKSLTALLDHKLTATTKSNKPSPRENLSQTKPRTFAGKLKDYQTPEVIESDEEDSSASSSSSSSSSSEDESMEESKDSKASSSEPKTTASSSTRSSPSKESSSTIATKTDLKKEVVKQSSSSTTIKTDDRKELAEQSSSIIATKGDNKKEAVKDTNTKVPELANTKLQDSLNEYSDDDLRLAMEVITAQPKEEKEENKLSTREKAELKKQEREANKLKRAQELEAKKKAKEEQMLKRKEETERKKKLKEEEILKKKAEAERKKKLREEEALKKKVELAAKKQAKLDETKRNSEEKELKMKLEAESKKRKEAEEKKKQEEEKLKEATKEQESRKEKKEVELSKTNQGSDKPVREGGVETRTQLELRKAESDSDSSSDTSASSDDESSSDEETSSSSNKSAHSRRLIVDTPKEALAKKSTPKESTVQHEHSNSMRSGITSSTQISSAQGSFNKSTTITSTQPTQPAVKASSPVQKLPPSLRPSLNSLSDLVSRGIPDVKESALSGKKSNLSKSTTPNNDERNDSSSSDDSSSDSDSSSTSSSDSDSDSDSSSDEETGSFISAKSANVALTKTNKKVRGGFASLIKDSKRR
ncbi:Tof2p NDAI_0B04950 [Naumovozyma dairenensis CBS 421]|uniref:Nucleolar protein Dnt1-like N-terminal domain-containing protein n=1 Tax=Naumovozyma dairenensis (strain ATCC 10597 / BCRC 20456 / CBS 421 / NBRC 0211 / NRRL Y-12639) TaxID=1071378 RepID=G0W6W7_NAUDC|nr:hypothetical protein NDAI_0B04950 [Naumovozyma dairenensis CBS 421]CCD23528.1 hypothetical protein NDAI_0B04950 [Naumovozyma dairenensis CBS 421]